MPEFLMLVDDGRVVATAETQHSSLAKAVEAARESAGQIAFEALAQGVDHQLLACEVQDVVTRERHAFDLSVTVKSATQSGWAYVI